MASMSSLKPGVYLTDELELVMVTKVIEPAGIRVENARTGRHRLIPVAALYQWRKVKPEAEDVAA